MHNNPMTHRILVADDERAVREFVSRALENDGYFVDSVDDGLAALGALAAHSYDLLLADIVMPGLEDMQMLYGDIDADAALRRRAADPGRGTRNR